MSDNNTSPPSAAKPQSVRRYDLDWVRVIVFGMLIPYHVALGYASYGEYIYGYANPETGGMLVELPMFFLHGWRLPALFVISGMGTCYAFKRRNGKQFLIERALRLLVPLIFCSAFIVVIQGYYRAMATGEAGPIWPFLLNWWSDPGLDKAAHLWFLINLFIYSLICTPLFLHLRNSPDGGINRALRKVLDMPAGMGLLLLPTIPLIIIELAIKPWAGGMIGDGYEFPWYLILFAMGYLCIIGGEAFWKALDKLRASSLIFGCIASFSLLIVVGIAEQTHPGSGPVVIMGGWTHHDASFWDPFTFSACILHSMVAWFWCMAVFSWAAAFLNRPSRTLTYLNQAVYPFYIAHMTFTLVGLYYFKDLPWPWFLEVIILTGLVFLGCLVFFEVSRRSAATRIVFGIKALPATNNAQLNMPPPPPEQQID